MKKTEEKTFTILVVEDDEGLSLLIEKNLSAEGFCIVRVHTGADAIAFAQKTPRTLMLLDYKLMDMNGRQVLEALAEKDCSVPFVIITGHGDEKMAVEMMKMGARDYLVKDMVFLDLLPSVIHQVIEQLHTEEALKKAQEERERLIGELQEALAKVKTLSGLLPICSSCKKIRDDQGYWHQVEKYILEFSDAELTHGLCPDCLDKLYAELERARKP